MSESQSYDSCEYDILMVAAECIFYGCEIVKIENKLLGQTIITTA